MGRDRARERMDEAVADGGPMGDGEPLDGWGRDCEDGEREVDDGKVAMYIGYEPPDSRDGLRGVGSLEPTLLAETALGRCCCCC